MSSLNKVEAEKNKPFKVMVVDDDLDVIQVTELSLQTFKFENRKIEIISCESAKEAKKLIKEHSDTALILLDVVMEEDDSGLKLVNYIREELGNREVRIIIRTAWPGLAPEDEVIKGYEVDNYQNKEDITIKRLFNFMSLGLRSYQQILKAKKDSQALKYKAFRLTHQLLAGKCCINESLAGYTKLRVLLEDNQVMQHLGKTLSPEQFEKIMELVRQIDE